MVRFQQGTLQNKNKQKYGTVRNPANLRKGQIFTVLKKDGKQKNFPADGERFRVLSVTLPFVYTEYYNVYRPEGQRFKPDSRPVDTRDYHIIGLNKSAAPL